MSTSLVYENTRYLAHILGKKLATDRGAVDIRSAKERWKREREGARICIDEKFVLFYVLQQVETKTRTNVVVYESWSIHSASRYTQFYPVSLSIHWALFNYCSGGASLVLFYIHIKAFFYLLNVDRIRLTVSARAFHAVDVCVRLGVCGLSKCYQNLLHHICTKFLCALNVWFSTFFSSSHSFAFAFQMETNSI